MTTVYKTVFKVSVKQGDQYVQIVFRSQRKKEDHEASAYADLLPSLQLMLNDKVRTENDDCPIMEECQPDHSYEAQLDLSHDQYYY
jgi:hypothetical protein